MPMIDLRRNDAGLERNLEQARQCGLVIPTIAELQNPDLIPVKTRELLKKPENHESLGLFRLSWYCTGEAGTFANVPLYREYLPEETGVPCRILALTGWGAPGELCRAGSQFGGTMPGFVTGSQAEEPMGSAMWHCNVTGFALAELFEAVKQPGDRLFGVCLSAEGGLTAAGDLILDRYPRAKLAVRNLPAAVPETCNVRNFDVVVEAESDLTACIMVAKYFELTNRDVVLTVLTENSGMSGTIKELTYTDKKCLHQRKESGNDEEFWTDAGKSWADIYTSANAIDEKINDFNDCPMSSFVK